jgi:lysophospholipid acyltransferase (LPLAT)-like uncharacterized protein
VGSRGPGRWLRGLLGILLGWAVRLLRSTWRVRVVGAPPASPGLFSFWHGDLLCLSALRLDRAPTMLISRSLDGDLATGAARALGLPVVRGSSSGGNVAGAVGLARGMRGGAPAALAVDGPRGPRHQVNASAPRLARLAGVEVIPVAGAARRGWRLRSWDHMFLPAPFTRVEVCWGEPLAADAAPDQLKAALDQLNGQVGEAACA